MIVLNGHGDRCRVRAIGVPGTRKFQGRQRKVLFGKEVCIWTFRRVV
ncbi:MAG: hypothetical protein H6947_17725 [Zoogloeaceae bacterium]|nr:hypothetical protein [Zoogloeaceae bacterium]